MPKSQKDTRGKVGLPGRLCGDDVVHQREEPLWIVLDLDVNVELDVLVLGLWEGKLEPDLTRKQKSGEEELTFISNSTVSAKVGMACLGSLMVRTCCIPESPYQVRSLIRPAGGTSDLDLLWIIAGANVPVEFVVLSKAKHIPVGFNGHTSDEGVTYLDHGT